ncbi:MAG TPA: hypothetical protein VMP01_08685 [Pirellulaceae bacterium]|nr:hypothetical protein [Pirellulaceae bacterium]
MRDSIDSVCEKVSNLFTELVGDRASRLGPKLSTPAMDAMTAALADEYGWEKAGDVALHMLDWNWDAAFIVALHLFPERFTAEEIQSGLGLFLCHAPNHIREACRLTDSYVWENFPDKDDRGPPD